MKANVLFFDRKPISRKPWTRELWVYDLRTNKNFTLRQNPITDDDLREFVDLYRPDNRIKRKETQRFKCFSYGDLMTRDKANLDIFWLKDDLLVDTASLLKPKVLLAQITADLNLALSEFNALEAELQKDT